jgi:hypothetical protein
MLVIHYVTPYKPRDMRAASNTHSTQDILKLSLCSSTPILITASFSSFVTSIESQVSLTMAHNILLIGGHGKVAQLLTPLLLSRSWNVTSMIRTGDQKPTIEKLSQGQPGKLNVLVSSVEDVKSEGDAQEILDQVKPDWVVWTAGM